jgi:hypothetical protein
LEGDVLDGTFDIGSQRGVITAHRTSETAETMFRPPEQRLDLTTAEWLYDLDCLVEILSQEHAAPFQRITRDAFEDEIAGLCRKFGAETRRSDRVMAGSGSEPGELLYK